MRCLTLAEELRGRGAEVVFACREFDGNLCDYIEEKGYIVHRLPVSNEQEDNIEGNLKHAAWLGADWQTDARQVEKIIKGLNTPPDWLVVDHYALDEKWEGYLRPYCKKIMVIDDLADRAHDCDLLLDQNLYADINIRYRGKVPSHCQLLLGPRYALLRDEFRQLHEQIKPHNGPIKRVLVFFGGVDADNYTGLAIEALSRLDMPDLHVDVVIGKQHPHREHIESSCAKHQFDCHVQTSHMAELMTAADLSIGAGGSAIWERCCLGLPAIVVATAENQVALSSFSAQLGLCLYLGKADSVSIEKIERALCVFCDSTELLQSFSSKSKRIVDGKGLYRVLCVLAPIKISLRQATLNDCDSIYQWRNAEETRRYIFDSKPIPIEIHRQWFHRSLRNPSRLIFVAEVDGKAVGILRYDFVKDEAVVSIYLVPGEHVAGTGTAIINKGSGWLREKHPGIKAVRAEILPQNIASKKAFMVAGYEAYNFVFKYDLTKCPGRSQQEVQ